MVESPSRSRSDFFQASAAVDSRVATKRVPIRMPAAPSASAATRPRPSAMPPAAMTGTETASTICGMRAMLPMAPVSGDAGLAKVARCPPASLPWATTASQPRATTVRASSAVAIIAITAMPRR